MVARALRATGLMGPHGATRDQVGVWTMCASISTQMEIGAHTDAPTPPSVCAREMRVTHSLPAVHVHLDALGQEQLARPHAQFIHVQWDT